MVCWRQIWPTSQFLSWKNIDQSLIAWFFRCYSLRNWTQKKILRKTLFVPNFLRDSTCEYLSLLFAYFHVVISCLLEFLLQLYSFPFHPLLTCQRRWVNVETSSHFKLLIKMVFNFLNFSILSQFFLLNCSTNPFST